MMGSEERLQTIFQKITDLKTRVNTLEKGKLESQKIIENLEIKLKQKQEKEEKEMSMQKVEFKEELNKHIDEIDECLDLLKTI